MSGSACLHPRLYNIKGHREEDTDTARSEASARHLPRLHVRLGITTVQKLRKKPAAERMPAEVRSFTKTYKPHRFDLAIHGEADGLVAHLFRDGGAQASVYPRHSLLRNNHTHTVHQASEPGVRLILKQTSGAANLRTRVDSEHGQRHLIMNELSFHCFHGCNDESRFQKAGRRACDPVPKSRRLALLILRRDSRWEYKGGKQQYE